MIGQTLMQPVADEPPDRDVDPSFPHQPAVVHDAKQKAGEHQTYRHLRIDTRTAVVPAVAIRHFLAQPPKVEHTIHPGQNMILGHQLIERPGNEHKIWRQRIMAAGLFQQSHDREAVGA